MLGVVGSGTMGAGIAQVGAQQGMDVVLCDIKDEFLDGAMTRIRGLIDRGVERGRMSASDASDTLARLGTTTDLRQLADCDCVIEAVTENLRVKAEVFQTLEEACSPE